MKFSREKKNKKNFINLSTADFAQKVVKIKCYSVLSDTSADTGKEEADGEKGGTDLSVKKDVICLDEN